MLSTQLRILMLGMSGLCLGVWITTQWWEKHRVIITVLTVAILGAILAAIAILFLS